MARPAYNIVHNKTLSLQFVLKGNSAQEMQAFMLELQHDLIRVVKQHRRQKSRGVEVEFRS